MLSSLEGPRAIATCVVVSVHGASRLGVAECWRCGFWSSRGCVWSVESEFSKIIEGALIWLVRKMGPLVIGS